MPLVVFLPMFHFFFVICIVFPPSLSVLCTSSSSPPLLPCLCGKQSNEYALLLPFLVQLLLRWCVFLARAGPACDGQFVPRSFVSQIASMANFSRTSFWPEFMLLGATISCYLFSFSSFFVTTSNILIGIGCSCSCSSVLSFPSLLLL